MNLTVLLLKNHASSFTKSNCSFNVPQSIPPHSRGGSRAGSDVHRLKLFGFGVLKRAPEALGLV